MPAQKLESRPASHEFNRIDPKDNYGNKKPVEPGITAHDGLSIVERLLFFAGAGIIRKIEKTGIQHDECV